LSDTSKSATLRLLAWTSAKGASNNDGTQHDAHSKNPAAS
jgi:hypothetical protein